MYKQYSFDSTFDFWVCNKCHNAMHLRSLLMPLKTQSRQSASGCAEEFHNYVNGNIFYQNPPKNRIWWFSCQL